MSSTKVRHHPALKGGEEDAARYPAEDAAHKEAGNVRDGGEDTGEGAEETGDQASEAATREIREDPD